jgi:hypothetical protein
MDARATSVSLSISRFSQPMSDPAIPDVASTRENYLQLREAQRTLNKRLQKMVPKPAFKECGERLGFWQHGQLVFDSEDQMAVFIDYAIYDYRLRGGTNTVERLWKLGEVKLGSPEHEVLKAMLDARFTVIRVAKVVVGLGAVVDDLFYGEPGFLTDVVLSENSEPGLTIAARLLSFPEFIMTTGAGFGIAPEFINGLMELLGEGYPGGFSEAIKGFDVAERSKIAARLIRAVMGPDKD